MQFYFWERFKEYMLQYDVFLGFFPFYGPIKLLHLDSSLNHVQFFQTHT